MFGGFFVLIIILFCNILYFYKTNIKKFGCLEGSLLWNILFYVKQLTHTLSSNTYDFYQKKMVIINDNHFLFVLINLILNKL